MILQKKVFGESSVSIAVCGMNGIGLLKVPYAIIVGMSFKGFTMQNICGMALMRKGESKQ